jgi:phosphoribosylformimino-5-aminoimidazole carboxamide ribotide isomerase
MAALTFYPAIDLLGGEVVRLQQGDRTRVTVYADQPGPVARSFVESGATWIHVVDLDAAFDGPGARQIEAIQQIRQAAPDAAIQLGGGLRDLETITAVLESGITRVLIGTAAVENRALIHELLQRFGAERIAVAVDEADGVVKVRGWVSGAGPSAESFARELAEDGVRWFLHSAILRDGTLAGPDFGALARIANAVTPCGGHVICAGGVGTLEHLRTLTVNAVPGVEGAVAGRALYEKAFTVADARAVLAGAT